MREEVSRVTQPVQVLKKEEAVILKYCAADVKVLKNMNHLKNIYEYYMKKSPERNRILLQCPKREAARQAAAAITNLYLNRYTDIFSKECEEQEVYTEDDEWEWYEIDEAWGEASEEKLYGDRDCLIVDAKKLTGDTGEDMVQQMMQMQMGNSQAAQSVQKLLETAENVLVECSGRFDEEKLIEILKNQQCGNIIVSMPDLIERRKFAERLMFEQGYECLEAAEPGTEYYEDLLKRYVKERGSDLCEEGEESVLVDRLMKFRGDHFSENDIFIYVDRAIEQKSQEQKEREQKWQSRKQRRLSEEDFSLPEIAVKESSQELIDQMIGLKKIKQQIEKLCAVRTVQELYGIKEKEQQNTHHNLAFAGAPGTGKSEVARLYSRILAERQVTNGRFVSAKRADIIGKYIGHTAPKIQKLFEQAEGGVLFIDEAGSLTADDDFTCEAVTELVRFMEENPQTTVIFATYPEKMQEFLNKDAGLTSRISKVLYFPSYSEEELVRIFFHLVKKSGWNIEEGMQQSLRQYIVRQKQMQGARFGNAREMRKLVEAAIENACHRICKVALGRTLPERIIRVSDVTEAMREMMPGGRENRKIGFAVPGNECRKE